eukprot:6190855-Pleurochrysis_carterae.AAC.1
MSDSSVAGAFLLGSVYPIIPDEPVAEQRVSHFRGLERGSDTLDLRGHTHARNKSVVRFVHHLGRWALQKHQAHKKSRNHGLKTRGSTAPVRRSRTERTDFHQATGERSRPCYLALQYKLRWRFAAIAVFSA